MLSLSRFYNKLQDMAGRGGQDPISKVERALDRVLTLSHLFGVVGALDCRISVDDAIRQRGQQYAQAERNMSKLPIATKRLVTKDGKVVLVDND
ncbi:MAG: hypothetical protein Q7R95_10500 [bacterium]|nr:hypothetical protein [bacterium]